MSATCARSPGLRRLPAITRDGTEIALYANLELPRELDGCDRCRRRKA